MEPLIETIEENKESLQSETKDLDDKEPIVEEKPKPEPFTT